MRFVYLGLGLSLLAIASPMLFAQEQPRMRFAAGFNLDTLRTNLSSITFDKSLNTYHWNGATFYQLGLGGLSMQLNEQFLSTLVRTDRKLITDNQSIDLHLSQSLSSGLALAGKISSFILSDDRGIGISSASSHAVYGGLVFQPMEALFIEPLIGYRFDNQIDQHDRGVSYLLGLGSDAIRSNGYSTRLQGSFQYDKLDPRTLETYSAAAKVEKTFIEGTRNFVQAQYYRNRRDFYLLADPAIRQENNIFYNIESRADNTFNLADTLDYTVSSRMLLSFSGMLLTREIDRSTKYQNYANPTLSPLSTAIHQLNIEGGVGGHYSISDGLHSSMLFSYQERDEQHTLQPDVNLTANQFDPLERQEERKNNSSRRTTLAGTLSIIPSEADSVGLSGSGSLLHYDTPSAENDDDRDELLYLVSVYSRHTINRYCSIMLAADMSLSHLVYLFSTRSADNSWNRILRFMPRIEYTPFQEFSTVNTFEVLANYTVYDFEYASAQTRSFAFRQMGFIDSTTFSISRRLGADWFSYYRKYERGELRWDSFSEQPVNDFEETTIMAGVRYALTERLLFSVGIRYFNQLRYGYGSGQERALENRLRSLGPTASISIQPGSRTELSVKGWYERQSQTALPDRNFTTMAMLLNIRI